MSAPHPLQNSLRLHMIACDVSVTYDAHRGTLCPCFLIESTKTINTRNVITFVRRPPWLLTGLGLAMIKHTDNIGTVAIRHKNSPFTVADDVGSTADNKRIRRKLIFVRTDKKPLLFLRDGDEMLRACAIFGEKLQTTRLQTHQGGMTS